MSGMWAKDPTAMEDQVKEVITEIRPRLQMDGGDIEFVSLGPGRALVVMVTAAGVVENRVIDVPMGLPAPRWSRPATSSPRAWSAAP